jgi:hypothetical protein
MILTSAPSDGRHWQPRQSFTHSSPLLKPREASRSRAMHEAPSWLAGPDVDRLTCDPAVLSGRTAAAKTGLDRSHASCRPMHFRVTTRSEQHYSSCDCSRLGNTGAGARAPLWSACPANRGPDSLSGSVREEDCALSAGGRRSCRLPSTSGTLFVCFGRTAGTVTKASVQQTFAQPILLCLTS